MYCKEFPLKYDCFAYITPEFGYVSMGMFYEEAKAYITEAAIVEFNLAAICVAGNSLMFFRYTVFKAFPVYHQSSVPVVASYFLV